VSGGGSAKKGQNAKAKPRRKADELEPEPEPEPQEPLPQEAGGDTTTPEESVGAGDETKVEETQSASANPKKKKKKKRKIKKKKAVDIGDRLNQYGADLHKKREEKAEQEKIKRRLQEAEVPMSPTLNENSRKICNEKRSVASLHQWKSQSRARLEEKAARLKKEREEQEYTRSESRHAPILGEASRQMVGERSFANLLADTEQSSSLQKRKALTEQRKVVLRGAKQ